MIPSPDPLMLNFSGLLLFIQPCLTLCNPRDCSMPGLSVLHCLPEFAQIHVHWVSDAIQPSRRLPPLSSLAAFNVSQHQCLFHVFASVGQSIGASASTSVFPMNIQAWFSFGLIGLTSLCLLISQLQSPHTVIKSVTISTVSPSICHEVMELDAMILIFQMLSFKLVFSLSSWSLVPLLVPLCSLPLAWCYLNIWGYWRFSLQSWFQVVILLAWHLHDVICI